MIKFLIVVGLFFLATFAMGEFFFHPVPLWVETVLLVMGLWFIVFGVILAFFKGANMKRSSEPPPPPPRWWGKGA